MKALRRAARGPSCCFGWLDFKVLFWVGSHLLVPPLVMFADPDAWRLVAAAAGLTAAAGPGAKAAGAGPAAGRGGGGGGGGPLRSFGSALVGGMGDYADRGADGRGVGGGGGGEGDGGGREVLQLLALVGLTVTCLALFASLYGSDPGRPAPYRGTDAAGRVSLRALAAAHWLGTPPPRPFDAGGLAANLRQFFLAPKPFPYRYRLVDKPGRGGPGRGRGGAPADG
ncbi:hypothetical protein GPECTOR_1g698 [Gonium pectorale]|uniref:Uncharacterized protein n=1 Tax=Gonium pectorale TaxID=33097 RepID=A0A150H3Y1_GONPE|nr:hypothetical protein GPECTOR_1g698 [Gonium pectorale]|eukprot:KXZ56774.1 hypothetical protein GPECTOR_1g698 [Gonium pectorale]